jgi:leucyl/phenylalanyl-tRNA--protein transferase
VTSYRDIPKELQPEYLLSAYASGAFPMEEDGEIWWFRPEVRGLLPLDERFHVSRSLRRTIRRGRIVCTVDRAFERVMQLCADRPEGTWIGPKVLAAYTNLHRVGFAHSVEAWPARAVGGGDPVGGVYGVALAGAFFAESMFHRQTDAGKVALVCLIERLAERGFAFCDVQWTTPHLKTFGAMDVPADEYEHMLANALQRDARFT